MEQERKSVRDFWDRASCGERLYLRQPTRDHYLAQVQARYALEPYVESFAPFNECRGNRLLEIGVGLGADHQRFAEAGAELYGLDLTPERCSTSGDVLRFSV